MHGPANYIQLHPELINTWRQVPDGMRHGLSCAVTMVQIDQYVEEEQLFKADF